MLNKLQPPVECPPYASTILQLTLIVSPCSAHNLLALKSNEI